MTSPPNNRPVEQRRRAVESIDERDRTAFDQTVDPRAALVGLALSGGGIRSATFALGVLQALGEHSALWMFDYCSTVSGGGFAGGWWSAWLSRRDWNPKAPQVPTEQPAAGKSDARKPEAGKPVAKT